MDCPYSWLKIQKQSHDFCYFHFFCSFSSICRSQLKFLHHFCLIEYLFESRHNKNFAILPFAIIFFAVRGKVLLLLQISRGKKFCYYCFSPIHSFAHLLYRSAKLCYIMVLLKNLFASFFFAILFC